MIYRCEICQEFKDDDYELAEWFDDKTVCPFCLENTPEEDLPAILKPQTS